jgi:hypothetical protein
MEQLTAITLLAINSAENLSRDEDGRFCGETSEEEEEDGPQNVRKV